MDKKTLISVIIPCYQVTSYIERCLDSVLAQTYQNLQIILVDDGSLDNSGSICGQYEKKDTRIQVIHQENQGLSAARNAGLSIAKGEYISFVDSDDQIASNMIEVLYDVAENRQADIVMCDYEKVSEQYGLMEENMPEVSNGPLESGGLVTNVMEEYFLSDDTAYTVVWNKLYKRELFSQLRFPVGKKVEDEFVSYRLLYEANTVARVSKKLYFYRMREDSIMNQRKFDKYQHACEAYGERNAFFKEKGEQELYSLSLYQGAYWCIQFYFATWEYHALYANWLRDWYIKHWKEVKENLPENGKRERMEEMERFACSPEETDRWRQKRKYKEYQRKAGWLKVKFRELKCWKKDLKVNVKYVLLKLRIAFGKRVTILSLEQSLDTLIHSDKGIVRFGDGELSIMENGHINFQEPNKELGQRLEYILRNPIDSCYIGVLDEINMLDFANRTEQDYRYWVRHIYRERKKWLSYLDSKVTYLSANITRPYIRYRVKTKCPSYFQKIRELWRNKDILIIEGEGSRLGVGNDLFADAKSIQRVLCPAQNAFDQYDEIFQTACELGQDRPIFLALGPTATVLGYELCKLGYLAYDVGHIDLEYEWMLLGTYDKVAIKNKYTNEVEGGDQIEECQEKAYLAQIVRRIFGKKR